MSNLRLVTPEDAEIIRSELKPLLDSARPIRLYNLPPHCASIDIAEEFARDLYAGRMDPSDPDDCFNFLAELYPNRLKDILANEQRAIYECGQLYIEAEIHRLMAEG